MTGQDPRTEQIRALIEEVDRIRGESERVANHVDRAMKRSFWPDRRRGLRTSPPESPESADAR